MISLGSSVSESSANSPCHQTRKYEVKTVATCERQVKKSSSGSKTRPFPAEKYWRMMEPPTAPGSVREREK